jgi:hypothetical protein
MRCWRFAISSITRYERPTNKPAVSSTEIHLKGESSQKAEIQLAVWAAAHVRRLCDLLDANKAATTDPLWLPSPIAQNLQWNLLFASRGAADSTVNLWNFQGLSESRRLPQQVQTVALIRRMSLNQRSRTKKKTASQLNRDAQAEYSAL